MLFFPIIIIISCSDSVTLLPWASSRTLLESSGPPLVLLCTFKGTPRFIPSFPTEHQQLRSLSEYSLFRREEPRFAPKTLRLDPMVCRVVFNPAGPTNTHTHRQKHIPEAGSSTPRLFTCCLDPAKWRGPLVLLWCPLKAKVSFWCSFCSFWCLNKKVSKQDDGKSVRDLANPVLFESPKICQLAPDGSRKKRRRRTPASTKPGIVGPGFINPLFSNMGASPVLVGVHFWRGTPPY